MKKLCLYAVSLIALQGGNVLAESRKPDLRGVVTNDNGSVVKSAISGDCVRTRWVVGEDVCAPEGIKEVKTFVIPQTQTKESARYVTEQHNRAYLVFFDFNRSNITQSAGDILGQLVDASSEAQSVSFDLIGHADRVGSDAYNMMLSQKRAQSVKDYLVGLGVSPANISVSWKGEAEPLVPTDDGITEPQNRRTEIKVTSKVRVQR